MRYVDPDGRDVKGAFRGVFHVVLSCLSIAGGVGMMVASGIGEAASLGVATPAAVAGVAGGYALLISGLGAFACSAAEMAVEIADCCADNIPDGDVMPSGIAGCIGSGIDLANGFDAQKEGRKGPCQTKAEATEALATATVSTCSYVQNVASMVNNGLPTKKEVGKIMVDEFSHQCDMGSAAGAIGNLLGE